MNIKMLIKDLKYMISLGVGDAERAVPQEVSISVELNFGSLLKACETDLIQDTVCYVDIEQKINHLVANKSFHTVEYLVHECFRVILIDLPLNTKVKVSVHKVNPPIGRNNGGVILEIEGNATATNF